MAVEKVTRLLILLATAASCAATPLSGAVNYTLQFVLITNTTLECIEVERIGSNVSVELSYRTPGGEWTSLRAFSRVPGDCNRVQNREEVWLPQSLVDDGAVQFRWREREQTRVLCNCWQIDDVAIVLNGSNQFEPFSSFGDSVTNELDSDFVCTQYGASAGQLNCPDNDDGLVFCYIGSASVPRAVVTPMFQLSTEAAAVDMCTVGDLFEPIGDIQFCDGTEYEGAFIKVSFQLAINGDRNNNDGDRSCDVIEFFDEGVELAVQRSEDEQWVPLKFYTLSNLTMKRDQRIDIGTYDQNSSVLSLQGYNVSVMLQNTSVMNVTEYICDERFFRDGVQFRWLQTVTRDSNPVRDTWFIDDVEISVHNKQDSFRIEFFDDFSDITSINATLWPQVLGGVLGGTGTDDGTACVPEGNVALFFGATDEFFTIVTRMAVIKPLDLRQATVPATTSAIIPAPSSSTGASSTAVFSSSIVPGPTGLDAVQSSSPISSATTITISISPPPISSHLPSVSASPPPIRSTAVFSSTTVSTTPPFRSTTVSTTRSTIVSTTSPLRSTAVFSSTTVSTTSPLRSTAVFSSTTVSTTSPIRSTAVSTTPPVRSTAVFTSTTVSTILPVRSTVVSTSPLLTAVFSASIPASLSSTAPSSNIVTTSPVIVVFSSSIVPSSSSLHLTALFSQSADVPTPSIPVFSSAVLLSSSIAVTSTAAFSSNAVPSSSPPVSSAAVLSTSSVIASFTVPQPSSSASTVSPSSTVGVASTPIPTMPTPTPQAPSEAVQLLMDLFNDIEEIPSSEFLSILRGILGNLSEGVTFPPEVSEQLFNSVSDLIDTVQQRSDSEDDTAAIGSTLLDVMDTFALGPYDPEQGELEDTENIALVHMVWRVSDGDPSDEVGITRNGSEIVLPSEVFMNINRPEVPVASYYYRNMSGLLPDSLPRDPQSSTTTMRLASPILSSALQCGSMLCNTRDMILTNPVVLVFHHSPELVDDLGQREGRESSVICVFFNFDDFSTNGLISGQWATEGCTRNETASNVSHTICECNHLTHFALLLSTTEIQLTSAEALSLRIIGIICVTISLVCLTVTILTFLFLKSLWNMRNYIHVNLCVSLFVAQLTFIVAVEPHGSVVGCQAVAVLLHYFFMVTFMWMLMEGVVLYVALVRVFIKYQNKYLITFTLASYGLPLLYLGITVPLGFVLQDADGPHYAGDDPQSCWLRYDSHFIWAFIAPVIIIILANIGFFIMAITIMYRHQRRQTQKAKVASAKHWLKTAVSLVVVMGITWFIGILVFNRDLLFVAYIYTIFIGLQGLAIFILFVVFSKKVREEYTKWWKVKVASSDFLSRHFKEKSFSQTGLMAVGRSTLNKSTVSTEKSKTQSTNISPSPDLLDNGHVGTLHEEEKEDSFAFNVTFIKGITSFELTPIDISDTGGRDDEEKEAEALNGIIVNGNALEYDEHQKQDVEENGNIETAESDSSEPEITAL